MSDTSMLRVSSELKTKLKQKAANQGRTLEWMANEALSEYLLRKPEYVTSITTDTRGNTTGTVIPGHVLPAEPTYEPMDDIA